MNPFFIVQELSILKKGRYSLLSWMMFIYYRLSQTSSLNTQWASGTL
jgi:hypothetical protein